MVIVLFLYFGFIFWNEVLCIYYNYVGKLEGRLRDMFEGGIFIIVLFLIVCSFIVLENLMVFIVIWKNNKFYNRMYFFIGNLVFCDLLVGVVYIVNILMLGKKTLSLFLTVWFLREGSMFVVFGAFICSLLVIVIERYLIMIKMRSYDVNKKYRVFFLIGMCWFIAFSLGVLFILGWNCFRNFFECFIILFFYFKRYIVFCISVFMVILVIIVILYARIYFLVKFSSRRVVSFYNLERFMVLLRIVVIVVSVFIVCWFSLFIFFFIDVVCKVKECVVLFKV